MLRTLRPMSALPHCGSSGQVDHRASIRPARSRSSACPASPRLNASTCVRTGTRARARGTPRRRGASGSPPTGSSARPRRARSRGCRSCGRRHRPRRRPSPASGGGGHDLCGGEDDRRVQTSGGASSDACPLRAERTGRTPGRRVARPREGEHAPSLGMCDLRDHVAARAPEPESPSCAASPARRSARNPISPAHRRAPPARRGSRPAGESRSGRRRLRPRRSRRRCGSR